MLCFHTYLHQRLALLKHLLVRYHRLIFLKHLPGEYADQRRILTLNSPLTLNSITCLHHRLAPLKPLSVRCHRLAGAPGTTGAAGRRQKAPGGAGRHPEVRG